MVLPYPNSVQVLGMEQPSVQYSVHLEVILSELNLSIPSFKMIYCTLQVPGGGGQQPSLPPSPLPSVCQSRDQGTTTACRPSPGGKGQEEESRGQDAGGGEQGAGGGE